MEPGWWKVKVAWVLSAPPPALRSPRTAARPSAGEQALRRPASELARAADAPGPGPSCPYDRAGRRRALPSHDMADTPASAGLSPGEREYYRGGVGAL